MHLAIFDLDHTLLRGDSDKLWGDYLISMHKVDPVIYKQKNDDFFAQYRAGRLDIHAYLHFALAPLALYTPEELHTWRKNFTEHWLKPLIYKQAAALVQSYKDRGYTTMIITATNAFITQPVTELLRVDHLLATRVEMKNNRYTGRYLGTPTFQHGKVTNLEQWLQQHADHTMEQTLFFSDSHNDLPLMRRVAKAVAVHPDPQLQQYAQQSRWPIIYFSE